MTNSIPFPQADDFNKIVLILNITDEELLGDTQYMQKYLQNITKRQISYFLSAAIYLGIIDKNKKFTKIGKRLRQSSNSIQKAELVNILLSDQIIRYSFSYERVHKIQLTNNYISSMIKEKYPDYSIQTCRRRASTVRGWIDWINKTTR